ncbi:UNVERIFIED_CONTAM: hypothetical protein K2H54_027045 [Gekko kuhli]
MKELPGAWLQKACRLLVVFCVLHLSAVLFYYYLAGSSTRSLQGNPEPSPRGLAPQRREETPTLRPANVSSKQCPDPSPLLEHLEQ